MESEVRVPNLSTCSITSVKRGTASVSQRITLTFFNDRQISKRAFLKSFGLEMFLSNPMPSGPESRHDLSSCILHNHCPDPLFLAFPAPLSYLSPWTFVPWPERASERMAKVEAHIWQAECECAIREMDWAGLLSRAFRQFRSYLGRLFPSSWVDIESGRDLRFERASRGLSTAQRSKGRCTVNILPTRTSSDNLLGSLSRSR